MQRLFAFFLAASLLFVALVPAMAQDITPVCQGRWGKEVNQLGIVFASPGVMPVAPYQCIGGYDVDADGAFWFSDSVNSMLKCCKKGEWTYIMLNFGRLGDLACFNQRIYVLTRQPDGIAVVNPESGKVERQIKIDFKNPGRIKIVNDKLFLIEEPGTGLLICRNDQASLHPAESLEAVADEKRIYGVQFNLEADSRSLIAAEMAEEVQEPEMIGLFEPGEPIVFSKTAGLHEEKPVLMVITKSKPTTLSFVKMGEHAEVLKTVDLPLFEAPFLTAGWKLCSDGNLYGFSGSATEGFKLFRSENGF